MRRKEGALVPLEVSILAAERELLDNTDVGDLSFADD
jgi:hypothetical protein